MFDATGFNTVTAPASSLLVCSVDEAKIQLNLAASSTYYDSLITGLIRSQQELAQNESWLQFFNATYSTYLPYFPRFLRIWKNPVSAINSVKYYDSDNVQQTLSSSNYRATVIDNVMTIEFKDTPAIYDRLDSIVVEFQAGYVTNSGNSFVCDSCVIATGVFTEASHGLNNGDWIVVTALGTVTGISLNTLYYVISATTNTFQISSVLGGSTVTLTGTNGTPPTFQKVNQTPATARDVVKLRLSQLFDYRSDVVSGSATTLDYNSKVMLETISIKSLIII